MPDVIVPGPDSGSGLSGSHVGDYLVRVLELDLACGGPVPDTRFCETLPACGLIAEYADFEFMGATVVGAGEMDLPPGCCDPGGFVTVACCPGPVPTTLHIFFDTTSGDLGCIADFGYIDLRYDSAAGKWAGTPLRPSGVSFDRVTLQCVAGAWVVTLVNVTGGGDATAVVESAACDPLHVAGHFTHCGLHFTIDEGSGTVGGSGDTIRVSYVDIDLPLAFVTVGNHYCVEVDEDCCGSGEPGGGVGYPRCDAGHTYHLMATPPLVMHATIELLKCDDHTPTDCPTPSGMDGASFDLNLCYPLQPAWSYVADPNPFPVGLTMGIGFELACLPNPDGTSSVRASGIGPMCSANVVAGCLQPGGGTVYQPVTVLSWNPFVGYWDKLLNFGLTGVTSTPCCDAGGGTPADCVFARVWVYE